MALFIAVVVIILAGLAGAAASRFYLSFVLVVINFIVFLLIFMADVALGSSGSQEYLSSLNREYLGFSPQYLTSGSPAELATIFWHIFAHGSWLHLLGNTIMLFVIGFQLENKVKRAGVALVYFVSGLGGSLLYGAMALLTPGSFGSPYSYSVGASGCIFGLLGAYWALYPNDRILFPLILIREYPVWLIAAVYFGFESFLIFVGSGDGINHAAHVGGFVTGIMVAPLVRATIPSKEVKSEKMSRSSLKALRAIADEQGLEDYMRRIEDEDIPEIRTAWTEKMLREASCPRCGGELEVKEDRAACDCGFRLRF
jgi:membrane associated rhomboid family serine protease